LNRLAASVCYTNMILYGNRKFGSGSRGVY
jgi:hypothetical protein